MISILRKIRKLSLSNGKLGSYLKYAIGEIVLIVAGILIALAINNRNTEINKEKMFDNGLSQLYTNLYCEIGYYENFIAYLEKKLEIAIIELHGSDSIVGPEIPERLDYLNYSGNTEYSSNSSNIIFQLQENVVSEEQNVLVNQISSYYSLYSKWDVVIEDLKVGYFDNLFREYGFSQPSKHASMDFTTEDVEKAIEIRKDENYKTQVRSTINKLNDLIFTIDYKKNELRALEEFIIDHEKPPILNFKNVGLLGSALTTGWEKPIPMKLIDKEHAVWNIQIQLQEGEFKFRNGNTWNQNWGGTKSGDGTAVFFGRNIPVKAGYYDITLNIQEKKYTIREIEKSK